MITPKGQPKGLYLLFVTEMWERFSYYGMRAIFFLYMMKALLLDNKSASNIFGNYTSLVYLTPLIGGYMADRYLGNRKSIILGGLTMALGQFFMFLSASGFDNIGYAKIMMFIGLGFLIVGNGFFKPNISTMVGQLYEPSDKRSDSAYTIFYMGINAGALLSPLICGGLGDTGNAADFRWGFLAACVGMLFTVAVFIWLKDKYIVTPDLKPIGISPNKSRDANKSKTPFDIKSIGKQIFFYVGLFAVLSALFYFLLQFDVFGSFIFSSCIVAPVYIIRDKSLTKTERSRIWVIYIIAFFVIFFWSAFEQAGASLTYFAEVQTDRHLGWFLPSGTVMGVSALLLLGLGYLLFRCSKEIKKSIRCLESVYSLFILAAISLILIVNIPILFFGEKGIHIDEMPASFFQMFNPIFIVVCAPLFSILWNFLGKKKLEPSSPRKQAMGLFLLAIGYLFIAYGSKEANGNAKVSMMWLIGLYFIHTMGELSLSPIGLSMVNKLSPPRFASLLMGVWMLSSATANKFAGTLSALYPEKGKPAPIFIGFKIESLHAYFMIFVFMAGAAAIILFALSSWLNKKMEQE
ncbi:MAG: peptide MFS transporter [Paludibacteraceae bacterium]|nr:peptide MFS transporter [Paludibacteraceae bacterium]